MALTGSATRGAPVPERSPHDAEISVRGLSMRYTQRGRRPSTVIDQLDLDIARGEFVTLVGASGCGKTTLLRIMAGLVQPTTGQVVVGGDPRNRLAGRVSFVFQSDTLLPWRTVAENVAVGAQIQRRPISAARVTELAELVGLGGYEKHYPRELSGGMRQRVNLARALATDPEVLFMDEPFAALDAQTREVMQQQLLTIWEETNKTVVFVTHQIDEAIFLADRVVVMAARPGRISAHIPVEHPRPRDLGLKRQPGFLEEVSRIWDLIRVDVLVSASTN